MSTPDALIDLVTRFDENRDAYRSGRYNETQARREFIDPLFGLLGWDVDNRSGAPEAYKDVVHEDAIKVGGAHKAPDYGFRTGGSRKFFVEAKKPSVNLMDDPLPAFQLRRYAWSAKLPLSILTDFEEFAVYDCRITPDQKDTAATARLNFVPYREYPDRWDEIASIFAKDAVLSGSLDTYAEVARTKRGTATVDAVFLREIESWRVALARDIAERNPALTRRDLNYAVQMTIDRIIFLRMTEDRGIEEYGRLQVLLNGGQTYARLRDLYRKADERYNSGLFHFHQERGREEGYDDLTPRLEIGDDTLKGIFRHLYFPDSPYEFSVLPVEVLGQVYEQFLGKVIDLDRDRAVTIEEKPEVRKAGGVYYTPKYIVDYIVEQTVGKLLEGKRPGPRGAVSKLRIVDPACGSGSFLIGAYEYLLDWHRDRYIEDGPERHKRELYLGPGGQWLLTTAEKRRILLNNIHGVDIDPQAVEVTKLSLLLKVLEGESGEALNRQLSMFHERALPDLGNNIKCGNSLIGPDFYANQQTSFFDDEEHYRINVFDWNAEFPEVFDSKQPGFDAVVGNPPYRRELDYKSLMDEIAATSFGKKYRAPRMDLWYYFLHRGLELLNPSGSLSFIVNAYWTAGTGASKLIAALRDSAHVNEVFFLGNLRVFKDVSGQHMILSVASEVSSSSITIKMPPSNSTSTAESLVTGLNPVNTYSKSVDQFFLGDKIDLQPPADSLLSKIGIGQGLDQLGLVRQGIAENPASINRKTNQKHGDPWQVGQGVFALSKAELQGLELSVKEQALLRPYHDLSDLARYFIAKEPSLTLIYSTRHTAPNIDLYPAIKQHLSQFRGVMDLRRETRSGSNSWWHLHWPRDEGVWKAAKVLSVQMGERPSFVSAPETTYVPFSVNVFVPFASTQEHLNYFTGVLNSRLLWKWFSHHAKRRGIGLEINGNVLSRAPIRRINFSNQHEYYLHSQMVRLVDRMQQLQLRVRTSNVSHVRTVLQRQIEATDRQIDQLVYVLYGLTDDEIAIVEAG